MADEFAGEVVIPIRYYDEEAIQQFEEFRKTATTTAEETADEIAAVTDRRVQAEIEAERRRVATVEQIEDRYLALSMTKGDEYLASKMLSLNRNYARELALVGEKEGVRKQIMERYQQQTLALEEEIAAKALALQKGAGQQGAEVAKEVAEKQGKSIFQMKEGMGRARETAMFFTRSLQEFGPSGRMMQTALAGVTGAIMGGGGLLLGLEAAQIAFRFFAERTKEAKEEAKKFADEGIKYVADTAGAAMSAVDAADSAKAKGLLLAAQHEAVKIRSRIEAADEDDQKELQKELDKIEIRIAVIKDRLPAAELKEWQTAHDARLRMERDLQRDLKALRLDTLDQEMKVLQAAEQQKMELRGKFGVLGAAKIAEMAREIDAKAWRDIRAQREKDGLELFNAIVQVRDGVIAKLREQPAFTLQEFLFGGPGKEAPKNNPYSAGGKDLSKEIDGLLGAPKMGDQAEFADRVANLDREWDASMKLADSYRAVKEEIAGIGTQAVQSFAGDAAKSLLSVTRQSAAYERAMRAAGKATGDSADLSAAAFASFAQNAMASVAEESATRAIFETAMGLAALARSFWSPTAGAEASLHFASAAEFGAVAAVAGVGALAIGQTRGMTAAEKASVAQASASGPDTAATSGGGSSTDPGRIGGWSDQPTQTREIVLVIGDPFESPAETARRVARRLKLAEDLNFIQRAS